MDERGTKSNEERTTNLFYFNDIHESLNKLRLREGGAIVCFPDRQMRFKGEQ
jgi:hypothetical protein